MAKIKIFGDSILQGVVYSDEAKRYKLRKGNKYDRLNECGIEVENHSRMGATVEHILAAQECYCAECDADTTVLLEIGGNDCDYNWQEISENPDAEHHPKTSPEKFVELYEKAITRAKESGARVAIASLVPIDAEKYMNWISRGLNYENILKWLGDVSMLSRWHEYYNRMAESLASKFGCILIDFRGAFLLSHEYKELICSDGIHPTQRGYDVIELILAKKLSSEITQD